MSSSLEGYEIRHETQTDLISVPKWCILDWFTEFLYKAVFIFAFAVCLVFSINFLSKHRYTPFLLFAFLTVVFGGFALGVFGFGDDQ
jgi:hypothetical protein